MTRDFNFISDMPNLITFFFFVMNHKYIVENHLSSWCASRGPLRVHYWAIPACVYRRPHIQQVPEGRLRLPYQHRDDLVSLTHRSLLSNPQTHYSLDQPHLTRVTQHQQHMHTRCPKQTDSQACFPCELPDAQEAQIMHQDQRWTWLKRQNSPKISRGWKLKGEMSQGLDVQISTVGKIILLFPSLSCITLKQGSHDRNVFTGCLLSINPAEYLCFTHAAHRQISGKIWGVDLHK